jgi:hypothetical protein
MRQYLGWLRGRIPGESICLVMDQYVVHTTQELKVQAEELGLMSSGNPKEQPEKINLLIGTYLGHSKQRAE